MPVTVKDLRPAFAEKQLSLTLNGNIHYKLKTPYREGTTHVTFKPLDFMARLLPPWCPDREPSCHASMAYLRQTKTPCSITSAKRGKGNRYPENGKTADGTPANRHASMIWTQRLKRVFNIDITTCKECGGAVKIIASIEDPAVIKQVLP